MVLSIGNCSIYRLESNTFMIEIEGYETETEEGFWCSFKVCERCEAYEVLVSDQELQIVLQIFHHTFLNFNFLSPYTIPIIEIIVYER